MGYLKYLKLMNRMNAVTQVPQPPVPQFEKYCKLFVTDEEYDIMMGMKLRGNTEAELRALYTGSDWDGTLYDMCRKGFLLKIYDGAEPTFDLAPMLPGWFEFPLSTGEDNETLQKASELFTSAINMVTTLNVEPMRTGYAAMLEQKSDVESRTRLENVRELRSSILTYLENADAPSLSGFLEEIALYTDIEQYDRTADAVVMMTVHSAKGLEFPEVYLVGAEDGLFPSARAIGEPEEMEEERRLCYVAITRAKRRLTITCAHQRMLYGRTTVSRPSRFLAEIPEELVERKQHTQPRFVQQAKPRPRPTMPHSDTLGSHHASGPVIDFRKGDTVEHDVFGRGLVLSVLPTGNDKMLEIAFDQIGTKRLMANFAASRMKKL